MCYDIIPNLCCYKFQSSWECNSGIYTETVRCNSMVRKIHFKVYTETVRWDSEFNKKSYSKFTPRQWGENFESTHDINIRHVRMFIIMSIPSIQFVVNMWTVLLSVLIFVECAVWGLSRQFQKLFWPSLPTRVMIKIISWYKPLIYSLGVSVN